MYIHIYDLWIVQLDFFAILVISCNLVLPRKIIRIVSSECKTSQMVCTGKPRLARCDAERKSNSRKSEI